MNRFLGLIVVLLIGGSAIVLRADGDLSPEVYQISAHFSALDTSERREFLERWRNVDVAGSTIGRIPTCHEYDTLSLENPLKVGVPYVMSTETGNLFTRAYEVLVSPGEHAAQRKTVAYRLDHLTTDDWRNVREEMRARKDPGDFSVLIGDGSQFFGTPMKWNKEAAEIVNFAVISIDRHVQSWWESQNVSQADRLIAILVGESVQWSDAVIGKSQVSGVSKFRNYIPSSCDDVFAQQQHEANLQSYVSFSNPPAALAEKQALVVVTRQGVSGVSLGSEYPSWPSKDELSPEASQN